MRTRHQAFDYREVHRSQIREAPYNPNVMSAYSWKLLRDKIEDVGVLQTLVWNEATGNLVGGHHRLRALDELEGHRNYNVGVSVVRLPLKREKELNVFLNNTLAQGEFDRERFLKLLEEGPLDLSDIGMTRIDLEMQFGDLPELNFGKSVLTNDADDELERQAIALKEAGKQQQTKEEEIAKMRQLRREYREQQENAPQNDVSYYLVLTFGSYEKKCAYLHSIGKSLTTEYLPITEAGLP